HPAVDTGGRTVIVSQMPFADKSRLITGVMEQQRESDQPAAQPTAIIAELDAMLVSVLSSQKTGATRETQRRRNKRVAKVRAFLRYAVDVGRLDERMTAAAQRVPAQVIDEDEDDVRTRIGLLGGPTRGAPGQRNQERNHAAP